MVNKIVSCIFVETIRKKTEGINIYIKWKDVLVQRRNFKTNRLSKDKAIISQTEIGKEPGDEENNICFTA